MTNKNKGDRIKTETNKRTDRKVYKIRKEPSMAAKKNQNNKVAKMATNNQKKEETKMAKKANEIKVITEVQMDNMIANGYQMDVVENSDEQVILKKGRSKTTYIIKEWQKVPAKKATKKSTENESEEKVKQVHVARDRDIKIDSKKVGDIGVKIIYHRMKDGEKQYRIFIAEKVDGKLKRTRLVNDNIKAIQSDEKKMDEYFSKITKSSAELKKVYNVV